MQILLFDLCDVILARWWVVLAFAKKQYWTSWFLVDARIDALVTELSRTTCSSLDFMCRPGSNRLAPAVAVAVAARRGAAQVPLTLPSYPSQVASTVLKPPGPQ